MAHNSQTLKCEHRFLGFKETETETDILAAHPQREHGEVGDYI
jgi:hypothetical protein